MKTIFVAATGQHIGKTTSTLGIVANLIERGLKTGYCKPVGQKYLTVGGLMADKDAVLFSKVINFKIDPDLHSPVILGSGATANYIEDPSKFNFKERILHANQILKSESDIVVHEGTGHPGVGSVVDLSNAVVAKMLDAGVVMIVEGGIGNTIDRLSLSLALFREQKVPILGVIVNKVLTEKKERVEYYLKKKLDLMGIPLLGVLPYDETLSFPIMATVRRAIQGRVILNEDKMGKPVAETMAASLVDQEEFLTAKNALLVVSSNRVEEIIDKIQYFSKENNLEKSPLSGVILTGDGRHDTRYTEKNLNHPYLVDNEIPVVTTSLDTYGSVVKISRIEVKINVRTPWKVKRAIELIKQHVNLDLMLEKFNLHQI